MDSEDDDDGRIDISPKDRDIGIRTIIGEENTPEGMTGVGATLLNRAQSGKYGGNTISGVAFAPGQFESWSRNKQKLMALKPDSPSYQKAAKIFDGLVSGEIKDPTNGATHFVAPNLQAQLGRNQPSWAKGDHVSLGKTVFYSPEGASRYIPENSAPTSNNGEGDLSDSDLVKLYTKPNPSSEISQPGSQVPLPVARPSDLNSMPPGPQDLSDSDLIKRYTKPTSQPESTTTESPLKTPPPAALSSGQDIDLTKIPVGKIPQNPEKLSLVDEMKRSLAQNTPEGRAQAMNLAAGASGINAQDVADFNAAGNMLVGGKNTPIQASEVAKAVASGVPILGAAVNPAIAGSQALMGTAPGGSLYEKYANALQSQKESQAKFAEEHPAISTLGGLAGNIAGNGALMIAAPEMMGVSRTAPVIQNVIAGGATGGLIGAADTMAREGISPLDLAKGNNLGDVGRGALWGVVSGLSGASSGSAAENIAEKTGNALSGTTPAARNISNILTEANITPQQARSSIQKMGPSATLSDIDPALTTEAGGLASLGGAPTSIMKNAMSSRAAQADNRVSLALDEKLGAKPDPTLLIKGIENEATTAASPFYQAAGSSGNRLDVSSILKHIDEELPNAVGGRESVLKTIKGYLTNEKKPVLQPDGTVSNMSAPKDEPLALLEVRHGIDDYIEKLPQSDTAAGKNAMRTLYDLRSKLNDVLKTDANIAAGDAAFSEKIKVKNAVQEGMDLFKKGTRIEDFSRMLDSSSPEELIGLQKGARIAIGDALDDARRGTLSGAQSMFGKSSTNRKKLESLFPASNDILDMINGEAAMRSTEQRVAGNSATAERTAVQKKYSPQQQPGMSAAIPVVGEALGGGGGAVTGLALNYIGNAAQQGFSGAARRKLTEGTARGLVSTGVEQQKFLDQLEKAYRTNQIMGKLSTGASATANLMSRAGGQQLQNSLMGQ